MNQKVRYRVVTVSSQDSSHPAANLLLERSTGWQSSRNPTYPQQITIQFPEAVVTKTLEVTSHQYKIASKVDVYIKSSQESIYRRLGYFKYSANKRSGYKAQEVKEVFFQFPCLYIKLVFSKHHQNQFNLFGQIGILSLVVTGRQLDSVSLADNSFLQPLSLVQPQLSGAQESSLGQKEEQINLSNPLSAEMIRRRMRDAASRQDFQQAASLKKYLQQFQQKQKQVLKLEREKAEAETKEDYLRCKFLKEAIDSIKLSFARGDAQESQIAYYVNNTVLKYSELSPSKSKADEVSAFQDKSVEIVHNIVSKTENDSQSKVFADPDERAIPALRKRGNKSMSISEIREEPRQDVVQEPDELEPKNKAMVQPFFRVIPQQFWVNIFSINWKNKEKVLKEKTAELQSVSKEKAHDLFNALLAAVFYTVNDKNFNVVLASLRMLQKFGCNLKFVSLNPDHQHIQFVLDRLGQKLIDTNTKIREESVQLLCQLPSNPSFGKTHCINSLVHKLTKSKAKVNPKLLLAKINILIRNLKDFRAAESHFDSIILFAKAFAENADLKVRQAINELIYCLCQELGLEKVTPHFDKLRPHFKQVLCEKLKDLGTMPDKFQSSQIANQSVFQQKRPIKEQSKPAHKQTPMLANKSKIQSQLQWPPFSSVKPGSYSSSAEQQILHIPKQKQSGGYIRRLDYNDRQLLERSKEYERNFFDEVQKVQDIIDDPDDNFYDSGMQQSIQQIRLQYQARHKQPQPQPQDLECQYCGMVSPDFEFSSVLDQHILEKCPLVIPCESCKEMVEVWDLTNHFLYVCQRKGDYVECKKCKLAFLANALPTHKILGCQTARVGSHAQKCQLCSKDVIMPGKESWKRHILNGLCQGCPRAK